jgi:hypothetical protein
MLQIQMLEIQIMTAATNPSYQDELCYFFIEGVANRIMPGNICMTAGSSHEDVQQLNVTKSILETRYSTNCCRLGMNCQLSRCALATSP